MSYVGKIFFRKSPGKKKGTTQQLFQVVKVLDEPYEFEDGLAAKVESVSIVAGAHREEFAHQILDAFYIDSNVYDLFVPIEEAPTRELRKFIRLIWKEK